MSVVAVKVVTSVSCGVLSHLKTNSSVRGPLKTLLCFCLERLMDKVVVGKDRSQFSVIFKNKHPPVMTGM